MKGLQSLGPRSQNTSGGLRSPFRGSQCRALLPSDLTPPANPGQPWGVLLPGAGGRRCPEPLWRGHLVTTRLRGRRRELGALKATQQLTDSHLWRCFRSVRWLLFALTGFEWFLIIDASFSFYLVFAAARKGFAFLH